MQTRLYAKLITPFLRVCDVRSWPRAFGRNWTRLNTLSPALLDRNGFWITQRLKSYLLNYLIFDQILSPPQQVYLGGGRRGTRWCHGCHGMDPYAVREASLDELWGPLECIKGYSKQAMQDSWLVKVENILSSSLQTPRFPLVLHNPNSWENTFWRSRIWANSRRLNSFRKER